MSGDRHSQAEQVELISDPDERARREAENGVRQFQSALGFISDAIRQPNAKFRLTQALILELHQKALEGIHPLAGTYSNSSVYIQESDHAPPRHVEVPEHMAEMCQYINANWDDKSAIHLAAYVMWRMNWIHPFADGNGRTARIVSYVVLSVKLNSILPGSPSIPDQIADNKDPYYSALEKSDDSWKRGVVALSDMEHLLETTLAKQLLSATEEAML